MRRDGTGVVSVSKGKLSFKAGKGKSNDVRIQTVFDGTNRFITFQDRYAVKAGKGCTPVKGDKTKVTCADVTVISVSLGDRNDKFSSIASAPKRLGW